MRCGLGLLAAVHGARVSFRNIKFDSATPSVCTWCVPESAQSGIFEERFFYFVGARTTSALLEITLGTHN